MRPSALISGPYRFWLAREWYEPGDVVRAVAFCGLNPSTADAFVDDPTIRREIGFAKALGANALYKVNLAAYRATDPKDLMAYAQQHGRAAAISPNNALYVREYARRARTLGGLGVFAAWGAVPKLFEPDEDFLAALGAPLMCLGTTKSGAPRHPLYLPKTACPVEWRA